MKAVSEMDHMARSRLNRFTAVRLDRDVERRDDPEWVAASLLNPETRLVPLWRSRSLLDNDAEGTVAVYLSPTELDEPDRRQQHAFVDRRRRPEEAREQPPGDPRPELRADRSAE